MKQFDYLYASISELDSLEKNLLTQLESTCNNKALKTTYKSIIEIRKNLNSLNDEDCIMGTLLLVQNLKIELFGYQKAECDTPLLKDIYNLIHKAMNKLEQNKKEKNNERRK